MAGRGRARVVYLQAHSDLTRVSYPFGADISTTAIISNMNMTVNDFKGKLRPNTTVF